MQAKDDGLRVDQHKPLLMVDVDGVLSLFGVPGLAGRAPATGNEAGARGAAAGPQIEGTLHSIDGMLHFLSSTAAAHLLSLSGSYELVWASGWEEKADEHLPRLLGVPARMPYLRFPRAVGGRGAAHAHWKLESIDAYAGERPLAWVDDAFNPACHEWAAARVAPTLLVQTEPAEGLTSREASLLLSWAGQLTAGSQGPSRARPA